MYLCVPACTLHVQPMYVGPFTWWNTEVLAVLLGDVTLQRHAVQGPLIPAIQTHCVKPRSLDPISALMF